MEAYTDLDFGDCRDTGRSVSGAVVILANRVVSWHSRMQAVMASGNLKAYALPYQRWENRLYF